MNKTLLSIVVLVGLFCLINCGRFNKNDDYKKVHQQRSKRRLQDVEKLMIEDEVLSYLICDMCGKKSCSMDYCQYCTRCNTLNELKLEKSGCFNCDDKQLENNDV